MKSEPRRSDSPPSRSQGRLVELDALRGLGAIAVVLYHLTTRFPEIFPNVDHVPVNFWPGEYRVLLFFAISGFAIFFTLRSIGDVADFAVNRFSRLFPSYWAAILLTLSFEYIAHVDRLKIPVSSMMVNFTMLQGFFYLPSVDGVYWTLTVELGFYACMLGMWLFLGRGLNGLEWMLLPWLACKGLAAMWAGMPTRLSMLLVLDYLPFFIIGILFHRIWSGQRNWAAQLPWFAVTLVVLFLTEPRDLFLAGCALVILFAATLAGWLRLFCVAPVLWVGQISYPLYLVHENIGFVIMLKAQAIGLNHWVGFAMALMAVLLLAWVLHRHVEQPANRWVSRRWKARKQRRGSDAGQDSGSGAIETA